MEGELSFFSSVKFSGHVRRISLSDLTFMFVGATDSMTEDVLLLGTLVLLLLVVVVERDHVAASITLLPLKDINLGRLAMHTCLNYLLSDVISIF